MPDGWAARNGIATEKHRALMHPTKRALLDAAVELFRAKGYAATGVQAIVDRAGLTKGAFYHHFTGKEDLLRDIHDDFIDYYIDLFNAIEAEEASPRQIIGRYYREFFLSLDMFSAEMVIFYQERRYLTGATFAEVRRKRDGFERQMIDVIERGIACGEFEPLASPELMLFGLVGLAVHVATYYRTANITLEQVSDMASSMIVRGLSADRPT